MKRKPEYTIDFFAIANIAREGESPVWLPDSGARAFRAIRVAREQNDARPTLQE
jgi:hypothetical protein